MCKGAIYAVSYVGCSLYKSVCIAASNVGGIACLYENQAKSITGQLNMGVRWFDMDTCLVNKQLRMCHGTNYDLRAIGASTNTQIYYMKNWLAANPTEVIVIAWSDTEHGKVGTDYPHGQTGGAYHGTLRKQAVEKYFTKATNCPGASCSCSGTMCYMETSNMKLSDMIAKKIRVVAASGKALATDSWSTAASKMSAQALMGHLGTHCTTKGTAAKPAGLAGFVSIESKAYWETKKEAITCPNHCTHPSGNAAKCKCNAGVAANKVLKVVGASSLTQSNETEGEEYACNAMNAGTVNNKLQYYLEGAIDKCLARSVPVSYVQVDYAGKYNSGIRAALGRAITKSVAKFR